ncbi:unnamed protein product [Clonostachys solani]|uniref:CBM6 domain-containing protein n=1 Tax=Clonostachys solani TaxID=160281 RepID=A0A9N9Z8F9_9HYPO|nr:unnamed protein product [Clonostachys solani]
MRTKIFALPLLALGGGVLASRCVPRSSSSLTVSTTPTLSTVSTESTPVLTPTTSTATPSISSTESSSESTTPSVSLSIPSTVSTPSIEPTPSTTSTPSAEPTPSTESTTLFTSASTTSSTALFRPNINRGQISIARDPVYEGSQSGNFQYAAALNSGSAIWGIYQSVDGSRVVADDPYQITLRIRVAPGTCSNVFVGGTAGDNARLTIGQVTVDVAAASVGWIQVTTVVRYPESVLSLGPGIAVMAMCRDAVSLWVDNVTFRKAV